MDSSDSPNTWKTWYDNHGPRFLLFARKQTRCSADAEDVLQEAMVRVWRRFGPSGNIPPSFIFTEIRRIAIDYARREDRRTAREKKASEVTEESHLWFELGFENDERRELIESAMRNLTTEQQEALVLKIWGELTFRQMGKILGVSTNTAASRYRYALENLRRILIPSSP